MQFQFCFFEEEGEGGLGLFNKHLEHRHRQLYKFHSGLIECPERHTEREVIYTIIDWRIGRTGWSRRGEGENVKRRSRVEKQGG